MAVPKFITNDMKGGSIGGPATPVRRGYVGSGLVYQGFSPASEQEFIQQTAAGGPAQLLKVYGKSIVNNQLLEPLSLTYWRNSGYGSWTYTDDVAHLDFTSTPGQPAQPNIQQINVYSPVVGHIYFVTFLYRTGENNTLSSVYGRFGTNFNLNLSGLSANMPWTRITRIITATNASMNFLVWCYFTNADTESYTVDFYLGKPNIIDLTLLYGAGNEPTSVAAFLVDYPEYNPTYDPGSLQSNKTAELRAERIPVINVWDEEWEYDKYWWNVDGVITRHAGAFDLVINKNPIPVSSGASYYLFTEFRQGESLAGYFNIIFADENMNYLGGWTWQGRDRDFTTPANAAYMFFNLSSIYGNTYNNDICINLSDPAINGQYFPHWRGSLQLNLSTLTGKLNGEGASVVVFPDGLRGVGTDRDAAYGSTGEVARAVVDLGTLNWGGSPSNRFVATLADIKQVVASAKANILCAKLETATANAIYLHQGENIIASTGNALWVYAPSYTDAAAFKAAMSGVMLDYPLATPLTYTLDTPLPTDLTCEQGDILQRASDNNCPFVGEMKFGL